MHQLMYLSSEAMDLSEADLREILYISRINNPRNNITGLLLFCNGAFLQILEGERTAVLQLYRKIIRDPRHSGLLTLFETDKEERDFSEWSMGFKQLSSGEWNQLTGFMNLDDRQQLLDDLESRSVEIVTMVKTFLTVNAR